jgi:hypothetical protein
MEEPASHISPKTLATAVIVWIVCVPLAMMVEDGGFLLGFIWFPQFCFGVAAWSTFATIDIFGRATFGASGWARFSCCYWASWVRLSSPSWGLTTDSNAPQGAALGLYIPTVMWVRKDSMGQPGYLWWNPEKRRDYFGLKLVQDGNTALCCLVLETLTAGAVLRNVLEVVAGGGIEPPTQGFSVLCSTNWATQPSKVFENFRLACTRLVFPDAMARPNTITKAGADKQDRNRQRPASPASGARGNDEMFQNGMLRRTKGWGIREPMRLDW